MAVYTATATPNFFKDNFIGTHHVLSFSKLSLLEKHVICQNFHVKSPQVTMISYPAKIFVERFQVHCEKFPSAKTRSVRSHKIKVNLIFIYTGLKNYECILYFCFRTYLGRSYRNSLEKYSCYSTKPIYFALAVTKRIRC